VEEDGTRPVASCLAGDYWGHFDSQQILQHRLHFCDAMASNERQGIGFTLHRSEVHAQCEADGNETKARQHIRRNRRGQLIRRGRVQFKELGAPLDKEDIAKMSTAKISKVLRATQSMGTQHHDARLKRVDGERAVDTSDAKDGELNEQEDDDLDIDEAQHANMPQTHGLFSKDLPRCTNRDKATDGFGMLREFVRESETRIQQVKSMTPGTMFGLDYNLSMLDYLMPPRSNYPPAADKRALSARASVSSSKDGFEKTPMSARAVLQTALPDTTANENEMIVVPPSGPRTRPPFARLQERRETERMAKFCPGRPKNPLAYNRQVYVSPVQAQMRPRPLPIRLPSLANFIAKSEPAMGGRSERGESSHVRDKINELLGLDKEKMMRMPQEVEISGLKRGRVDIKRKIEKQLDSILRSQGWLWLVKSEDGKKEPERVAGSADAPGVPGAEEVVVSGPEGVDRRRQREATVAEEAEAYAKFVALLREPDPTISPVARLRCTLSAYQDARDRQKSQLQNALYSMDADRLNSLRRRAKHLKPNSEGPTADAKAACALMRLEAEKDMLQQHTQENMKKQYLWYSDLWSYVRGDKRDLPKVAHFIFDFVKNVLEYGEEFNREMYFAMLEHIENYEFTAVIANLTVCMTHGIEGIVYHDILEWFVRNRGEVPTHVADLTSKSKDRSTSNNGPELTESPDLVPSVSDSKGKHSLTFVTEVT